MTLAITANQGVQAVTFGSSTATVTVSVATGNAIFICFSSNSSEVPFSITDNVGNTYTATSGGPFIDSANGWAMNCFWCASSIGNITTVTIHESGAGDNGVFSYCEITGADTSTFAEQQNGAAGASPANYTNVSVTPGFGGDLVISVIAKSSSNATTASNGFTTLQQFTTTRTQNLAYRANCPQSVIGPSWGNVSNAGVAFTLAIKTPLSITAQPLQKTGAVGGTVAFSVTASSSRGTVTYQWYLNGSSISGATSSSFTTGTLAGTNNGDAYYCIVSDGTDSAQSNTVNVYITGLGDKGKSFSDRLPGWFISRRGSDLRLLSDQLVGRLFGPARDNAQAGKTIWLDWVGLNAVAGAALAGSATAASTATGALTTAIKLAAAATSASTATGALTTGIPLLGAATSASTATGALTTAIKLAAAASSISSATGALTTQIVLLGAAVSASSGTGDLDRLQANAQSVSTLAADLTTIRAAAASVTTATGALTTAIQMAAAASSSSSATGALTTAILMLGAAVSDDTWSADLTTGGGNSMGGAAASLTSAAGALTTAIKMLGDAIAATTSTGSLSTGIALVGVMNSATVAAGALTTAIKLLGAASDFTSAAADLTIPVPLNAAFTDLVSASGALSTAINLASDAFSTDSWGAALTVLTPVPPPVFVPPPPPPPPPPPSSALGGYLDPIETPAVEVTGAPVIAGDSRQTGYLQPIETLQ